MEKVIPSCPNCNSQLKWKEKNQWYACPQWKPNNQGCEGYIYKPGEAQKGGYKRFSGQKGRNASQENNASGEALAIVIEEMQGIEERLNKRFDGLAKYLQEHLEKKSGLLPHSQKTNDGEWSSLRDIGGANVQQE